MDKTDWSVWARTLQQKQLTGVTLTLLEGAGPVRLILSQVLFSLTPFIGSKQTDSWTRIASLLEDPTECRSFASYLREEKST
ncbi:MAG: hypothetical protein NTZ74_01010 [Chloroflexi bacterium]|nr:hypothetical protein [Chloroflexota bacterium]